MDVGDWNPLAGHWFSRWMDAVRYWYPDASYSRTPEIQESRGRGAIHLHVLLVTDAPVDVYQLWRLARRAGFGCVFDVSPVRMGGQGSAARYVSGYMVKGRTRKHTVPWNRLDAAGRARVDYRHSKSRDWPVTYQAIMAARREHVEGERLRAALTALAPLGPVVVVDPPPVTLLEATPP